ncbi:MAG: hypothetical protein V4576_01930 [Patescibacteria group bacterium]
MSEESTRIRLSGYSSKEVTITGLDGKDLERIRGFVGGAHWIRIDPETDRIEVHYHREQFPDPVEDETMRPFWKAIPKSWLEQPVQIELVPIPYETSKQSYPQIIISHICGYKYSEDNYAIQTQKLLDFGFTVMRSKRNEDTGMYFEQWILHSQFSAKGSLDGFIKSLPRDTSAQDQLDRVVNFLCRQVQFGTLDLAYQRAAMVMD